MPIINEVKLPDNIVYGINATKVSGHTVGADVPSDAVFTDTIYSAGTGTTITGDENNINVKYGSVSGSACEGNDSRLSDARPASDVYDWAKAQTKPTYTAAEVDAIATTAKGSANGVAELDANGKVPSAQLPSFVDDVIEGYYYNGKFYEDAAHTTEITGESGKIYIDLVTEKTYRWGGSTYAEISPGVVLGETDTTAYRGDRGKVAYDHATDSSRLTTAQTSAFYKFGTTAEGHIASVTPVLKSDITGLGIPGEEQIVEITGVNYDNLPSAEKNNGKYYHIIDRDGSFMMDQYVKQVPNEDTVSGAYELILAGNQGNNEYVGFVQKTDTLTYNPYTKTLRVDTDDSTSGKFILETDPPNGNTNGTRSTLESDKLTIQTIGSNGMVMTDTDITNSSYWYGTETSLKTEIGSLHTAINSLNTNKPSISDLSVSAVTDLDNVTVNAIGKVQLDSTVSPDSTTTTVGYICFGIGTNRTLMVSDDSNNTYICNRSNNTWSNWTQLNN